MKITLTQVEEIISLYYDEIFLYCRVRVNRLDDAYDLTQDVFLALVEQYASIDRRKVRKWLYRVAHNFVVDYYKLNKREQSLIVELESCSDAYTELNSIFETLSESEAEQYRTTIISQLTEKERILYQEIYWQHKSYPELSRQYHISEAAMRKRVSRLSHKLRSMIKAVLYLCLHILQLI